MQKFEKFSFKEAVPVISSDPQYKDDNVRFTTTLKSSPRLFIKVAPMYRKCRLLSNVQLKSVYDVTDCGAVY